MSSPDPAPSVHRVLIVDDDALLLSALARMLARETLSVFRAASADEALAIAEAEDIDVVVSDLHMPGMGGLELLRKLRETDIDLPVIFLTGAPSVETAAMALAQGAFRYLLKPVDRESLVSTVDEAVRVRALSRSRDPLGARHALEKSFRSALDGMWMALQPIVKVGGERLGFEALLRSREPTLPHPGAILDAAEKLGAIHAVGRRTRSAVAEIIASGPDDGTYFVNLHSADLADDDLFDPDAPLTAHAHRVVLELTERATLEGVGDLTRRMASLRTLGFRIAVDDLGAGYAGLSYFAVVQPEIVKIDMSLIRGIDADTIKQRVVASIVALARSLDILVVAEGVETIAERDRVVELGCDLLQGYLLARPGPPYPTATWTAR